MQCESQGNPKNIGDGNLQYKKNGITYGASFGLFQIRHLPGRPDPSYLLEPENNVKYAYQVFKAQSWTPWSCKRELN